MRGTAGRLPLVLTGVLLAAVWTIPCAAQRTRARDAAGLQSSPMTDAPPLDEFDVPPNTPATLDGGATLNPLLLGPVRDSSLGLEYQDRPAYYYALWLSQKVDVKTLSQYAAAFRAERRALDPKYARRQPHEFPTFVDVFQHPDEYRGRPVTLHGYFRKLVEYDAGPNDLDIGKVYEGWIYTDDSQSNPGLVVFTGKPNGLPLGGDITEEVQFTGYFLKMYGYEAQDTFRKAPMFLAGDVQWFPARPANARLDVPVAVYVAGTLVVAMAVYGLWRSSRRRSSGLARYNPVGRDFAQFPPQEFLDNDGHPIEPHH